MASLTQYQVNIVQNTMFELEKTQAIHIWVIGLDLKTFEIL